MTSRERGDWEQLERRGAERELNADEILRLLIGAGADFVVIGGFAVIAHGYLRATKDIDIVPRPTAENRDTLERTMLSINARPIETYSELRDQALEADIPEVGLVRFASLEHLELMKRVAGRPQDLSDLAQLEDIRADRK